jgi:polysaccharide biosynthesis/export protein
MTPQPCKTPAHSHMKGLQVILVVAACLWRTDVHAQYRLDSGDVVEVSVFGVQDFKRRSAINVDGDISLPLLGDIRAAGLTVAELRTKLRESLAKSNIIRSPDVTAEIVEHRPFYVNGNVAKPGAHPYQPSLTVRHAVAIAGGYELMRFRMENPLLLAADLRSQYESLWTEYVGREARVTSLRASLDGTEAPDFSKLEDAPVARRIISDLIKLEMDYFNVRSADQQKETKYLELAKKHAEDQVNSLIAGQQKEEEALKLQAENLARSTTLSKQGLTTTNRVTDDQRAIALLRSRQLDIGMRLADSQRIFYEYGRRIEKADGDNRVRLLRELQEAVNNLDRVRTQLHAVGEKLLYVAAIKSQIAEGRFGDPHIVIYRKVDGKQSPLAADESTEVHPGDVIDIAFAQKQLLLSGTR